MDESRYPLFTVIIPQKNRAEYLYPTIRTCTEQDYPNFEIIVSDDHSNDNSVEIVKQFMQKDPRVKLFAHDHHLGMRDNFEFALSQVRAGYVIALGGDDGLLPGCIWKMHNILSSTKKELLTWDPALFVYLDEEDGSNILTVKRVKNPTIRIIKSIDFLNQLSRSFQYQVPECPMFYMKGVVSTKLIDRVKSRTSDNSFYYCPTPDGFSGVVLAGEVEEYVYSDEPLSIGGATKKSQGIIYGRTDEQSRKEAEQFFKDNIRKTMHSTLASQPYSPLTTLMTADYLLTARDLPGWPGKFDDFSISSLIIAAFKQIENSPYENAVLVRELKILRSISEKHGLFNLFEKLYRDTKRNKVKSIAIKGFAITRSIRLNGADVGIKDIYDASLVVPFIFNIYNKMTLVEGAKMIYNSFKILFRSKFKLKTNRINLPSFD